MTREEAIEILENTTFIAPVMVDVDTALDMAISALSAEGEYIKKEDTLKALHDFWDECINFDGSGTELMLDNKGVIDDLPTYSIPDSAKNKGEWIYTEDRPEGFCSKCDKDIAEASTPYCPYCGAKMTWVGAIHEPYKKGE